MKTYYRALGFVTLLACSTAAYAVPDAVCGKGKHVGNPHCASSSSAPMGDFGASAISSGVLLLAGAVGFVLQRRKTNVSHADNTAA
ncbi:hypothetical protein P4S70_17175 [Enterovibrio sp. Hal110]